MVLRPSPRPRMPSFSYFMELLCIYNEFGFLSEKYPRLARRSTGHALLVFRHDAVPLVHTRIILRRFGIKLLVVLSFGIGNHQHQLVAVAVQQYVDETRVAKPRRYLRP